MWNMLDECFETNNGKMENKTHRKQSHYMTGKVIRECRQNAHVLSLFRAKRFRRLR